MCASRCPFVLMIHMLNIETLPTRSVLHLGCMLQSAKVRAWWWGRQCLHGYGHRLKSCWMCSVC